MRVNEPPLNSFLPENAAHGRRDVEVHKNYSHPRKKKQHLMFPVCKFRSQQALSPFYDTLHLFFKHILMLMLPLLSLTHR